MEIRHEYVKQLQYTYPMIDSVLKKMKPDRLAYWGNYFLGFVITASGIRFGLLSVILGVFILLTTEMTRNATTFYVSEGGIAREYRLVSRSKVYAEYDKIQNLHVTQGFVERMLGVGSVLMDTAGSDHKEIVFFGIKDPHGVEELIRGKMIEPEHVRHVQ